MNLEKIYKFLHRMKVDMRFRSYYHGLYDSLHKRIFDNSSLAVIQYEKKWSTKIDGVFEEELGALEGCEEERVIRRTRVTWLEQIKADELSDRNLLRTGLAPLPV